MNGTEFARRKAVLERMDKAAYDCSAVLSSLVKHAAVKHPRAIAAVKELDEAIADYKATNVVDRAAGGAP